MRDWLIGVTVADVLALITVTGVVAIFDRERGERAFKVLRLILGFVTGTGVAAFATLHQAGLL